MLDAGGADQRKPFLEGRDRLGAVGGVEHAARMRLERDESRLRVLSRGGGHGAADDVKVSEVDAVEAPNCERNRPDVTGWKPQMD